MRRIGVVAGLLVLLFGIGAHCDAALAAQDEPPPTAAPRRAGPVPGIEFETRYMFPARLDKPGPSEEGAALSLATHGVRLSMPAPLPSIGGYVLYGFRYRRTSVWLGKWPGGQPDYIGPLQSFTLDARVVKPLAEGGNLTFMINLGYHGEAADWGFDAVRLQGGVMYDTAAGRQGRIGYGLFYSADFGQPIPLPIFFYRYEDEAQRVELIPPLRMFWWKKLPPTVEAGLGFSVQGDQYHVNEGTALPARTIKYSSLIAGPGVKWRPRPWATLSLDLGYSLYERFEVMHGDSLVKDLTPRHGWHVSAGFGARF